MLPLSKRAAPVESLHRRIREVWNGITIPIHQSLCSWRHHREGCFHPKVSKILPSSGLRRENRLDELVGARGLLNYARLLGPHERHVTVHARASFDVTNVWPLAV